MVSFAFYVGFIPETTKVVFERANTKSLISSICNKEKTNRDTPHLNLISIGQNLSIHFPLEIKDIVKMSELAKAKSETNFNASIK